MIIAKIKECIGLTCMWVSIPFLMIGLSIQILIEKIGDRYE